MMIEFALEQPLSSGAIIPERWSPPMAWAPSTVRFDYYRFFADLDVASDDLYFDIGHHGRQCDGDECLPVPQAAATHLDHRDPAPARSCTTSRPSPHSSAPGPGAAPPTAPRHMWSFGRRTCLFGQEQELQGILEHTGAPRHRYQAVKACFTEPRHAWDELRLGELSLSEAPVAVV